MSNPWLTVPLSEYEQHMSSVAVQQLGALSDLFAEVIGRCRPLSVAILGIAGGNGLDHIDSSITARVVGLDLNPLYLEAVRDRYSHLPGLELHCVDLSERRVELEPVQLVHAALSFRARRRQLSPGQRHINDCSRREFVCCAPVANGEGPNLNRKPVFLDSESGVPLFVDQSRMAVRIARREWISTDSPNKASATRR